MSFKSIMVGIELDCQSPIGNNGSIDGITYFQCKNKHGTFVKPCHVVKVFLSIPA